MSTEGGRTKNNQVRLQDILAALKGVASQVIAQRQGANLERPAFHNVQPLRTAFGHDPGQNHPRG
jgi:hypothetical protein